MSGGGGKGGSETTKTEIPAWIRDPAIRNLARAEAVQRIPYMPYYGGDVAAFTPTQNAAFEANIGAGEAFGLLGAGHGLTATSGMPTPTDYDGFTGYSSQPMYESALAELKAKQPGAVAQYDALFGGNVPTTWGNNPRFRGSAGGSSPSSPSSPPTGGNQITTEYNPDAHRPQVVQDAQGNLVPLPPAYGNMEQFKDSGYDATKPGGGDIYKKPATVLDPNYVALDWDAISENPSDYGYGVSPGHPSLGNYPTPPKVVSTPTNVGNPFGYGMQKKK